MNTKNRKISSSSSYQNLNQGFYQPLSPFNKLSTPFRGRMNTSNPSIHASPINFTSALTHYKSPNNKENNANVQNHSPMLTWNY